MAFLGVDIGAGSLKSSLISAEGTLLATASFGLETATPHPGWAEQHPADWVRGFCETVPQVLAASGLSAADVRAISFSAGAHSPVILGADDQPLRPAMLWMDQRAGPQSRALGAEHGEEILRLGYNQPFPTWTLPQLKWLAAHEPRVRETARRVLVAKDYLRFWATGVAATDIVDAQGTLLWECAGERWSERLTALADWDLATLPPVLQPHDRAGTITQRAAAATGLAAGTPVITGSSDTAIELFGAGGVRAGQGGVKLATAGTISLVAHQPTLTPDLINYSFVVPGLWYTVTGTNACASAHRWLRDIAFQALAPAAPVDGGALFEAMDQLAAAVPPGADGLLFHPYLNGERSPHWDPDLRADFVGLTFRHGRGHLVRALYEGIAFSLRDCLQVFNDRALSVSNCRLVGGGAKSALWQQIVADVLGLPIEIPRHGDASYGAALMAAIGVGAFAGPVEAADACVEVIARRTPDPARHAHYQALFGAYQDTQRALAPICHRLKDLAAAAPAHAPTPALAEATHG